MIEGYIEAMSALTTLPGDPGGEEDRRPALVRRERRVAPPPRRGQRRARAQVGAHQQRLEHALAGPAAATRS